jgi:hypothetical protein
MGAARLADRQARGLNAHFGHELLQPRAQRPMIAAKGLGRQAGGVAKVGRARVVLPGRGFDVGLRLQPGHVGQCMEHRRPCDCQAPPASAYMCCR